MFQAITGSCKVNGYLLRNWVILRWKSFSKMYRVLKFPKLMASGTSTPLLVKKLNTSLQWSPDKSPQRRLT